MIQLIRRINENLSGHIPRWIFIGSNNSFYKKPDMAIMAIGNIRRTTLILPISCVEIKNIHTQS